MKIDSPLDSVTSILLLEKVWGFSSVDARNEVDRCHHYFQRYNEFCRRRYAVLQDWTHEMLFEVAEEMLTQSKQQCADRFQGLCQGHNLSNEHVDGGLYFIARLVFCVDLDHWYPAQTLAEHLHSIFILSKSEDKCRLPRSFNACTISRITDINITWTHDLNHHLEVTADDGDIVLFHGASFLKLFRDSSTGQNLFPAGLLQETGDSLSLLCPNGDRYVSTWLEKEQRQAKLDPALQQWCKDFRLGASGRQIQSFGFWRDNLIVIKEIYDEREPRKVKHWWRDHRRPMQWWTFWVAITAFFLSLVASVLGSMQVYKAYHPTPA